MHPALPGLQGPLPRHVLRHDGDKDRRESMPRMDLFLACLIRLRAGHLRFLFQSSYLFFKAGCLLQESSVIVLVLFFGNNL